MSKIITVAMATISLHLNAKDFNHSVGISIGAANLAFETNSLSLKYEYNLYSLWEDRIELDTATPVSQNVFLYGRKDKGALNSEFFFQYSLTDNYRMRIGLSHQVIEYVAKNEDTGKLQRFYNVAVFGLDYLF